MASLGNIFLVFSKIGAFTIGGGYAMIPVIADEMQKRGWIESEDIEDVVVLAQSAPGLLAVNMAIFAGYKIRGLKGSIAATLGAILPSFLIILAIAAAFSQFKDNVFVTRFFAGVRPVAVALIISPAVSMARHNCTKWWHWAILAVTLVLVAFLKVSPIWILLTLIACAAALTAWREKR